MNDIEQYLSNNYDINKLHQNFQENGKIVIENFLNENFAEKAYNVIINLPLHTWFNCCGSNNIKIEKRIIPINKKKQELSIMLAKNSFNKDNFSYNFHRNMGLRKNEITIVEKIFRDIFSNSFFLNLINNITNLNISTNNQLFLSKYKYGHFLSPHSDINNGKIAYVLGMTKNWKPQYGGVLHFMDEKRENIIDSYVPKFNTLILFKVPENGIPHFVSHVNIQNKNRYTITGWLN
jgi:Rps23 Pro-64 3,4-dihydroxylase Tpa1-like proline 4-hydroxylase